MIPNNHASTNTSSDQAFIISGNGVDSKTVPQQEHRFSLSTPKTKANICLVPKQCSVGHRHYKQNNGIHAEVYTAVVQQTSLPESSALTNDTTPESQTLFPFDDFLSLLSYSTSLEADQDPVCYLACNNKEDILTQSQMLKASDATQFIECQGAEIEGLLKFKVMDAYPISNLPPQAKLISSIWSYRRKRLPNGVLLKHKARLCVNGKEQEFGRDFWETYAPVASWSTIRMIMLLSTIMNLKTRQVDYTQAFPQAELHDPVFMKVPQGWYVNESGNLIQHEDPKYNDTNHYLQLKRNLYGCKQAARNWYKHLTNGLVTQGFTQSKVDSCLFLRKDCIIVVYVDDCLIFAPSEETINKLIQSLSNNFLLQDEGDVSAFLGVQVQKDTNTKTISLTQPGLIEQVIKDIGLDDFSKGRDTPADSILYADVDGPARQETWNYRSVIGKLNYIANNTRPDISMAVHQCARFCNNPKALHELAVKRIIRYLHATKDKGMILKPTTDVTLNMFVDADFAGMWHKEYAELRDNLLSRTGFIITFCGCPVAWSSKLQTEIALSTTESEYIALSMAIRELLPLRRLLEEILAHSYIHFPKASTSIVQTPTLQPSQVYEDNSACIVLATTESTFKPRTKHIALKFHHFHDQVRNGTVQIAKVATDKNWADIFTKPLVKQKFQNLRYLMMGW